MKSVSLLKLGIGLLVVLILSVVVLQNRWLPLGAVGAPAVAPFAGRPAAGEDAH